MAHVFTALRCCIGLCVAGEDESNSEEDASDKEDEADEEEEGLNDDDAAGG